MYDLVIRGGTVVDGLGHDPISTDVAVKDGRIAKIGAIPADAAEVVDAGGLALMPGIIDLHTHYDAQVTWDPTLSPSPSLGVTTAVMGNCGFGIVPSPPLLRDMIMRNLAVVEGMDLDALRAGIDWRFQSFAEYMRMLRDRGPYMNLGVLVGHSAVRTAVMGEEASIRKELYIQITCQPLSFDFTLASAYPFYSHPAFDPIKAYDREQLKAVFRDRSFRESFRTDLRNPKPGTVFQGNWERVIVAAPVMGKNAGLADRTIADIAREAGRDPLDVLLDLGLEEDLNTGLIGRFFNAVDDGVEPLVKHKAGVIALSDAGARLGYLADAGVGVYFLGHWVRERGAFDLPEGVRRLTSHQAGLDGIPNRGSIAVGACADLLLFDPATVGISAARRVNDLPGGGPRTIRDPVGVHGVFVNGVRVFDGRVYAKLDTGPGQVLDRFLPTRSPDLATAAE